MNTLSSVPRSTPLDCVVTRRIPRAPSSGVLPLAGDSLELPEGGHLIFDAPFEATSGGWSAPARLVAFGRWPFRGERVEIAITATPMTAARELRVVPRSLHASRWSARRVRRWFSLAHEGADALATRLTVRSRIVAREEMANGIHP
jgi:hypothetical protein